MIDLTGLPAEVLVRWRADIAKFQTPNAEHALDGVSTKVLLAVRTILKFDPSEPRDDAGKWTSGGDDGVLHLTTDPLHAAINRWSGSLVGVSTIRAYAAGQLNVPPEYRKAAAALIDGVQNGDAAPTLYRGINLQGNKEDAAHFASMKAGDTLDLNLSSWTTNDGHAMEFRDGATTNGLGPGVMFVLEPGARGVDVDKESGFGRGEEEWITDGRFSVTRVLEEKGDVPGYVVWLNQERPFTASELHGPAVKYSPDHRGRWTSGGDTGPTDIREKNAGAWTAYKLSVRPGKRDRLGNCYQAATRMIMDARQLGLVNPRLIQATVTGQGPVAGRAFGHSWVEAEDPAGYGIRAAYDYSNGREIVLPADLYRQIGHARDVHEYAPDEARVAMLKAGHYGPWDD